MGPGDRGDARLIELGSRRGSDGNWGQQMTIQEAQLDPSEASTAERPRSRRLVAIIASTALVVILAAIGAHFAAFRSLPTTVSSATSGVKAVNEQASQQKASPAAADAEAGIFAGFWNSHGGQLVVNADGSATLKYRVYVWCSDNPTPPCDQVRGNLIISGGQVNMHVVRVSTTNGLPKATVIVDTSSDPKIPSGSLQSLELNGGVITWTNYGQPFCGAKASQANACGA